MQEMQKLEKKKAPTDPTMPLPLLELSL